MDILAYLNIMGNFVSIFIVFGYFKSYNLWNLALYSSWQHASLLHCYIRPGSVFGFDAKSTDSQK